VHVRPVKGLRRQVDIVFLRVRVAVFVDGCFWHGCPAHGVLPRRNSFFWQEKIDANRSRDYDTTARLVSCGWSVVRVWEHEHPHDAADRVQNAVLAVAITQAG
jgi:DNA mismatch endonuclease, patch repair protein